MHEREPTLTVADLGGYPGPVLVMVGDDEPEIPLDHLLALRDGLPRAQLAVVPGTGHGLFAEKPALCNSSCSTSSPESGEQASGVCNR
jgi:pimeloyl-ACP methyl ester carboxylesterase